MQFIKWLEMAIPREIDKSKVYFHGTPTKVGAQGILKNGIQPPDLTPTPNKLMRPIPGQVYITRDLKTAIIYALGGDIFGSEPSPGMLKEGEYGYVFEIPGSKLTDIQPDEDSVGEMVHDLLTGTNIHNHNLEKVKWLRRMALLHLTPRQLEKVRSGEYAYFASVGKKLIKRFTDQNKLDVIDAGGNISNTGPIQPTKCWRIRKTDSIRLKEDGSNFFKIATRVK